MSKNTNTNQKKKCNTRQRKKKTYTAPNGQLYKYRKGTRRQVWIGSAYTTGKLTRDDLVLNKRGRIVSSNKSLNGQLSWMNGTNPLVKKGYVPKFGTFKPFQKRMCVGHFTSHENESMSK